MIGTPKRSRTYVDLTIDDDDSKDNDQADKVCDDTLPAKSEAQLRREAQALADHEEFLENRGVILKHYLQGGQSRQATDQEWQVMGVWKLYQASKQQQSTEEPEKPKKSPKKSKVPAPAPARKQSDRYDNDKVKCPKLPSRDLEDYSEVRPGVYRCLHDDSADCISGTCSKKGHDCCRTGYSLKILAERIKQKELRAYMKIEREIEAGKLDPRHKTWTGYYTPKLADTHGKEQLFFDPLPWSSQRKALKPRKPNAKAAVKPGASEKIHSASTSQAPQQDQQALESSKTAPTSAKIGCKKQDHKQLPASKEVFTKKAAAQEASYKRKIREITRMESQARMAYEKRQQPNWGYFQSWWSAAHKEHIGEPLNAEEIDWRAKDNPQFVTDKQMAALEAKEKNSVAIPPVQDNNDVVDVILAAFMGDDEPQALAQPTDFSHPEAEQDAFTEQELDDLFGEGTEDMLCQQDIEATPTSAAPEGEEVPSLCESDFDALFEDSESPASLCGSLSTLDQGTECDTPATIHELNEHEFDFEAELTKGLMEDEQVEVSVEDEILAGFMDDD